LNQRTFQVGLAIAFVATVVASIRALTSSEDAVVQPTAFQHHTPAQPSREGSLNTLISTDSAAPVKPVLAAALNDPFHPALPLPTAPATPKAEPVNVTPPAPAPVVATPFSYTLFGRLRGPDGQVALYLAREAELIPIQEGTELQGDYRVEKISTVDILIRHAPTNQELKIALAPEVTE
jgi:hypothetical protein